MIRCVVPGSEVVTQLLTSRCAVCAAQDLSSFYIVWATGHVTETLPDLPTTTNPYNVNPLNKSQPGAFLSCWWTLLFVRDSRKVTRR